MRNALLALGLLVLVAVLSFFASGCGDGGYRYPCQDPANWELDECQPPVCEADGTCPEYLIPEGVLDE